MADTTVTKNETKTPPVASVPANGATPTAAPAGPVKEKAKREVPMIGVSAKKDEYEDIKKGLSITLGGLNMDVGLGPFVLACALKTIRGEILPKAK